MALEHTSVEESLLVDFRSMRIEIYRKEQKGWLYDAFESGEEVEIDSLGVRFPVADAYEDVVFENEKKANI